MERIERYFLESSGVMAHPHYRDHIRAARSQLKVSRKVCESQKESPLTAVSSLTHSLKHLLQFLIIDSQKALGAPPVKWAAIAMGSMARDEMCPYSDIEFGFLLEQATPEALKYFRTLAKFLQLRIINLGETKFPVFGALINSPTCSGFSLDTGGNTPLGMEGS